MITTAYFPMSVDANPPKNQSMDRLTNGLASGGKYSRPDGDYLIRASALTGYALVRLQEILVRLHGILVRCLWPTVVSPDTSCPSTLYVGPVAISESNSG